MIMNLSRRRDCILEAPMLELEALGVLAADYKAAHMSCMPAELKKKLICDQGRSGGAGDVPRVS